MSDVDHERKKGSAKHDDGDGHKRPAHPAFGEMMGAATQHVGGNSALQRKLKARRQRNEQQHLDKGGHWFGEQLTKWYDQYYRMLATALMITAKTAARWTEHVMLDADDFESLGNLLCEKTLPNIMGQTDQDATQELRRALQEKTGVQLDENYQGFTGRIAQVKAQPNMTLSQYLVEVVDYINHVAPMDISARVDNAAANLNVTAQRKANLMDEMDDVPAAKQETWSRQRIGEVLHLGPAGYAEAPTLAHRLLADVSQWLEGRKQTAPRSDTNIGKDVVRSARALEVMSNINADRRDLKRH